MSAWLGEPIKIGRFLAFVSGDTVSLCTILLTEDAGDNVEIEDAVRCITSTFDPERLEVWGLQLYEPPREGPWRVEQVSVARPYDSILQIDLASLDMNRLSRHRNFRRATSGKFQVSYHLGFVGGDILSSLMEPYLGNPGIPVPQRQRMRLALREDLYEDAATFVAMRDGEIGGAQICRVMSSGVVVARWAFFRKSMAGASDSVYWNFIDHYRECGMEVVDLGYGTSETLFRYKQRWGASVLVGPVRRAAYLLRI
ncbi:hypothetical protein GCM10017691_04430 [Pseudonocardia petroleophila]